MRKIFVIRLLIALIGFAAIGVVLTASTSIGTAPYRMSYEAGVAFHRWQTVWAYGMAIGAFCSFAWIKFADSQIERRVGWCVFFCLVIAIILDVGGSGPHSIVSAKNVCINNLRQIDAAKEEWASQNGKALGEAVIETGMAAFLKEGKIPICPEGAAYSFGRVGEVPRCSVLGHTL
jgi:hypothetical protein